MIFTPNQIAEILQLVDVYTVSFVAKKVGTKVLSDEDKKLLKQYGFSDKELSTENITQAFKFGMISMALGNSVSKSMTYDAFKQYLKSGKFYPLSTIEQQMVDRLNYLATSEAKRLASNIKRDIERKLVMVDGNKAIHSKSVLNATKQAIEERKSVAQLAGELGHMTGQWNRDLGKIADYVMHEAFNEGRVAGIERNNSKVYFDVYPGACKHCIKHYLTAGIGSEPKVFEIDKLRANGTNVGRKVDEWKPTISPLHPFCRCTASEVPDNFVWDPETNSFTKPKEDFVRKVERKSKVSVTVNNKTTVI